jgi:L-2,4-diaminobutyric acid acetyltransferase
LTFSLYELNISTTQGGLKLESIRRQSATTPRDIINIGAPQAADGADIWQLIADSGALDENSLYCNLLQCSHFAETCAVARMDGKVVGWMSGYIPPQQPDTLFVWQICVSPAARKRGLASRLIRNVLNRRNCQQVRHVSCTITKDNAASWKLFGSLARELDASLEKREHFSKDEHFQGMHDSEFEVVIGPFQSQGVRALRAA